MVQSSAKSALAEATLEAPLFASNMSVRRTTSWHVVTCRSMTSKLGSRIWVRTSNFNHPVNSVAKLLCKHPYNHKLQILLPLSSDTVQAISTAVISGYYYATQIQLSALLEFDFIQANVRDASLFCACLDSTRCLSITPDGWLHVVMSKQQYQGLGLVGERITGTGRQTLFLFCKYWDGPT